MFKRPRQRQWPSAENESAPPALPVADNFFQQLLLASRQAQYRARMPLRRSWSARLRPAPESPRRIAAPHLPLRRYRISDAIQNVAALGVVHSRFAKSLRQRIAQRYRIFAAAQRAPRTDHVASVVGQRTDQRNRRNSCRKAAATAIRKHFVSQKHQRTRSSVLLRRPDFLAAASPQLL